MNSNNEAIQAKNVEPDIEILNLNLEDLDVEELEHRLELATALAKPNPNCTTLCASHCLVVSVW